MQTVSATELARNTRLILDKVINRGETMTIERNNIAIAQIVPPLCNTTVAQVLVGLSVRPISVLTSLQAKSWLKDSKDNFNESVLNPWV
jgi:antitoxin (DNA-binding transcriptional repressor) of toxin-antitoxin stability system